MASRSAIKEVKKRKIIRISLRIHPAPFPTAGLTIDALKRGKRVVVVIAETRKSVLEHNRSTWQHLGKGNFSSMNIHKKF